MKTIAAVFFDGKTSRRRPVVLSVEGDEVVARGDFGERRAGRGEVEISEPLGSAPRSVRFPDGSACEVADLPAFAAWLGRHGFAQGVVVRLQARWSWALAALAATLLTVAAAYLWLLPAAAAVLAPRVPPAALAALSENTLALLDAQVLTPSALPEARRAALASEVALLAGRGAPAYRLHFRSARMGPNAFALPSGDIVVFDELVAVAGNDAEVAAVIAHELGHVAHRHGIRQLIQSSVVSFVAGIYFGDVSSVVSGLSALLLESRYSRDFEREADAYAARTLRAAGRDPAALAVMLERIEAAHGGAAGKRPTPWWQVLSSHPETAERARRIRAGE